MHTRIKMCGMTRVEDVSLAVELGVDAIGLIFYEPSPRFVTVQQAQKIVNSLPPYISAVGIFVDATQASIQTILQQVNLDLLQFHGHEPGALCRSFHKPYVKMINMSEAVNWAAINKEYEDAKAFLLDKCMPDKPGGTGEKFSWDKIPQNLSKPIILAGGLTSENVGEAIRQVGPYAVDVTSGIEASKGIKDPKKMAAFVAAVKIGNKG